MQMGQSECALGRKREIGCFRRRRGPEQTRDERGRGGICLSPFVPQIESQIEFPFCALARSDKLVLEKDALFSTIKFPPLLISHCERAGNWSGEWRERGPSWSLPPPSSRLFVACFPLRQSLFSRISVRVWDPRRNLISPLALCVNDNGSSPLKEWQSCCFSGYS